MMNATRRYRSHKNCGHASTKVARAICRAAERNGQADVKIDYVLPAGSKVVHKLVTNDAGQLFACTRRNVKDNAHLMPAFEALDALEGDAKITLCKNCEKLPVTV